APCNPNGSLVTEPVTHERCLARGHLDNQGLELKMCIDHLPSHLRAKVVDSERADEDDRSDNDDTLLLEQRPEPPVPPELPADAALKCPTCAEALRQL